MLGSQKRNVKFINAQEAYNLWDMLSSKYKAYEEIQLWENFAHYTDLKYSLGIVTKSMRGNIKLIEKEVERYGIRGPEGQIIDINSSVNSEVLRDEFIASDLMEFVQESIDMLLRAIRTSTTNDGLRDLFTGIAREAIDFTDKYAKYMKLKGWLKAAPTYPHVPASTNEKLDVGEAFHLWDHLTFRNDNIEQTQTLFAYAHDKDFKLLLKEGLQDLLQQQAEMLERELRYFGIPLPKRPPRILPRVENTDLRSDDNIFRQLFIGIQGAVLLHSQAFKQSTTNDRIRSIFKELLLSEINIQDRMIKFGKLKGWLNPVPQYSASKLG